MAGTAHGPREIERETHEMAENRRTASLAGLAVALALVIACLALFSHLHKKALVEDCLLAGRSNCGLYLKATPPPG